MAGLRRLDEVLAEQEQMPQPSGLPPETAGPFRDLGPRLASAYYGSVQAAPRAYLGAGLRWLGFDQAGQALADSASQYQQLSQQAQQGTLNNWDDVHGVGDFTRYASGAVGNALASYLPGLLTTAVTRRPLAGLATMFPQEAGETVLGAPQDADPGRIFGAATAKGAVNTAIESAPWMHLFGRGPLRAVTEGVSNPVARFGGRVATQMAGEGATEVAQEAVGQQAQTYLDPTRDRSQDMVALREAGLQGALGAGPFGVMAGVSGAGRDSAEALDSKFNTLKEALNKRFPTKGDPVQLRDEPDALPGVLEQLKTPAQKLNERFASTEGKSTEDIAAELGSKEDKKFSLLTGINTAVEDLEGRDSFLLNTLGKDRVVRLSNQISMRRFAEAIDEYVRGEGPWGIRNNPEMTPDVDPFRKAVAELLGTKGKPNFEQADALFERYASAVPQEQRGELWQGDAATGARLAEDVRRAPDNDEIFGSTEDQPSYHFWDAKHALPFATKPPPSAYKRLRDSGILKVDPNNRRQRTYGPQSMLEYALENGLDPDEELARLRQTVNGTYEPRLESLRANWRKTQDAKQRRNLHLDAKRLTQLRDVVNLDTDANEILSGLHVLRTEALPGDDTTASDRDLHEYSKQKYGRKDGPSSLKFWKQGAAEPLTLNASMILATELKRDANAQARLNAKGAPRYEYLLNMLHDGIARVMNRGYALNLKGQQTATGKGFDDKLGLRRDMPVWREKEGGKWKPVTYGELLDRVQELKKLPKDDANQAIDVPPQSELAAIAQNEGFQYSADMQDWLREHAVQGPGESAAALEAAQAQADGYNEPLAKLQRRFDLLDGKIDDRLMTRDEYRWVLDTNKTDKARGIALKALSEKRRALLHGRGSWQALASELRGEIHEADLGEGATSTQEIAEAQDVQERQMPQPRLVEETTGLNLDAEKRTASKAGEKVGSAPKVEAKPSLEGLAEAAGLEVKNKQPPKPKREGMTGSSEGLGPPTKEQPETAPPLEGKPAVEFTEEGNKRIEPKEPKPEKITGTWKQAVTSGMAAEVEKARPQLEAERAANVERRADEAAKRMMKPRKHTANFDDGTPRAAPTDIAKDVDNPNLPKPTDIAAGILRPVRAPERESQEEVTEPVSKPAVTETPAESRQLGEIPMYYKMPPEAVRADLRSKYPNGTTTAQLMADGHRTATTRRPFGAVGDTFTVQGDAYRITAIEKVDLSTPNGRKKWSDREGWDVEYVRKNLGKQVYTGATQTVFERVGAKPAEKAESKVQLPAKSPYVAKDQAKSDRATKFIGQGSETSSTAAYAKAWGDRANTGKYTASDVVFVSAEGNRAGRVAPNFVELNRATEAGATILTDDKANRERAYNVGERAVAAALTADGYVEVAPGEWKPATKKLSQMDPHKGPGMTRRTLTKENKAALEKEVFRLLGDKNIDVAFRGAMKINPDGGAHGSFRQDAQGKRFIEIASNIGLAPAESAAHHEALHGLFALLDSPTGPPELRQAAVAVRNAVRSAKVRTKLRELLKDHPAAWEAALHDPEEAAAYTFQFWRAGLITNADLNPSARNFFERLARWIRKFAGLVSTNEKALAIFNAFQEGKFANADPSIAGAVIRDMRLKTLGEVFKLYGGPAYTTGEKMLVSATDRLRQTGIPTLERLANMYHKETNNEHGRLGFLQRRQRQKNLWQHEANIFLKSATQEQLARALKTLQNQEDSDDPLVVEARKLLERMHEYQTTAGVTQTELDLEKTKAKGKDIWADVPLRKAKNYWPRLWDFDIIQKNEEEFKKLLMEEGKMDADQADKIFLDLMADDKTPLRTGVDYTPYMLSASTRVLTFIKKHNAHKFAKFQYQDLVFVMTMYIYQATHRAEYAKTFGNHGETIKAMMQQAEKEGATKEQLEVATKAVQALNGTLGWDMDRERRQMMQNLMAYENIVLLPMVLLQNFSDIMGIAMRSDSFTEAWKAFKMGIEDLVREIRKQPRSAQDNLADMIGLMDDEIELANYGMSYDGVYIGGFAKKVNDRFFKYTGMQSWNRSMRTAAMITAINFIQKHWTNIKTGNDKDGTSARKLEELGLKVEDIRINPLVGGDRPAILKSHIAASFRKPENDKDVEKATEKIQEAIFRFVDGAVIRPNAAHRPIWGSDPHWMLIFHLKQFTYSFTQVFHKYIAKELDHGNAIPGYVMLTLLPFSLATGLIKAALLGRPMDLSPMALAWQALSTTGATGTAGFAIDAFEDLNRNQAPGVSFIGPTAGHALMALQTLAGSPQDSWSNLVLRSVPASPIVKAVVE